MAIQTVKTTFGNVSGIPCGNPAYTVFKGVPYAAPPVGELRWQAPANPVNWEGVKVCDTFPPISVQNKFRAGDFYQKEFFPVQPDMSEDCLYLNIWTPANEAGEKLPVMFWIHGGAFIQGFGHEMEFDGEAFCKRGVILVTINYRLGAMGFFAHPDGINGNFGLLDQIQALKWVHSNIESFGGDPANITVFGQSAGGVSTLTLCASPLTTGIISKAIPQSAGGIGMPGKPYSLEDAQKFGAYIVEQSGVSLEDFRRLSADEVNEKVMAASATYGDEFTLRMKPCTDGNVLPDDLGSIIAQGKHHAIPYMTGYVSGDTKIFNSKQPVEWHKLKNGNQPLYVYEFTRDIPGDDKPGAFHSGELWYIFGTLHRCWRPMSGADYDLSLKMTDYWTNFAKNGSPNGNNLPLWSEHTEANPHIMQIKD
jgi:para-nitrobenzyl esterase